MLSLLWNVWIVFRDDDLLQRSQPLKMRQRTDCGPRFIEARLAFQGREAMALASAKRRRIVGPTS